MFVLGISCPVCSQNLADLGSAAVQEDHVRMCLEGGAGASSQAARYLVYKLPAESALIGTECKSFLSLTTYRDVSSSSYVQA